MKDPNDPAVQQCVRIATMRGEDPQICYMDAPPQRQGGMGQQQGQQGGIDPATAMKIMDNVGGSSGSGGGGASSGSGGLGLGGAATLATGMAALYEAGEELDIGVQDQMDVYHGFGKRLGDLGKNLLPWEWF